MTPEDTSLDRAHALMMAALDGECSAEDRRELEEMIAARPELRQEWQRLTRLQEVTVTMALRQPPEEVWDRYWTSVYNRVERGIAWLLVSAGAIVLGAWAAWRWVEELFADTGTPLPIRLAILAVAVGLLILAVSVVRERWFVHRHDPYSREVLR